MYHVGGLQTSVFETVLCLQILADLISLWRPRLEEDLAVGEETVKKCLILCGVHSEGTCDLLRGKCFSDRGIPFNSTLHI